MSNQALDQSVDFIKSWLQFRYDREEIPGYAVAIMHKGKILLNEAYGYANLENQTKLTPDHIFRVASHSKSFTATALMQLQEQGKLRIDDYAADYLPWLKNHTDKRWHKVTLRQLASHGAGVIRDGVNADYWQLERPFPDQQELRDEILKAKLVIEANTKLKYSNYGYSVLSMVIEAVSGMPYNQYVTENIIVALGLKNTGPEYTKNIAAKLVTGYGRRDNKERLPIAHVDTKSMSGATGFYATAEDLCNYFAAHFVGSGKLLDDESKKEMQRVQWHVKNPGHDNHEDYGLGIDIEHLGSRKTIGHGGGFPGHITKSIADPDDELVVIVLTNCLGGPASMIAKGIFEIISYYQKNTSDKAPKHNLAKLQGRYMNLWGMAEVVVTGDKLVVAFPDMWQPLSQPEELEYVDDTTFKVTDTGSFDSEGELVRFNVKDDKIESVIYNGSTMWPEKVWLARQANRKIVE